MDESPLRHLPDELLEAIVLLLPPAATLASGATCKRLNKIAYEHLVWRRHCIQEWKYWEAHHELQDKLERPSAQVKWRHMYIARHRADNNALRIFNELLQTQQQRIERIEEISKQGYDMKDLLLSIRDETPDDAEDVLARRFYAQAILGQIYRTTAIKKWMRLQRKQMVRLEEVLGAYDLFVAHSGKGDLNDIDEELDRIAKAIRDRDPEFDSLSIRKKAVQIAEYLRSENLVGNPNQEDYHALRNNFISIALFDEAHTSLPLQSVAIYCSVARRLGVNAKPSNYPSHVHAIIEAPANMTLDGKHKAPSQNAEPETMHMDPWRTIDEVPLDQLTLRLRHMGIPASQHDDHLRTANAIDMALRTGRNIMNSVQEARDRQRGTTRRALYPDIESAWYSMLWSMLILSDTNEAATLNRRRQCLPYLAEHFQTHFPWDLGLIETHILPMFEGERDHMVLLHVINTNRAGDRNAKAPNPRVEGMQRVEFKVGQVFQHKRYGYEGIITGWDAKCNADARWIHQMRVDDLSRGRDQPFYNVVADDRSSRYVAEENIARLYMKPCESLMQIAGHWFKRWDDHKKIFASNIKDAFPDD